MAQRKIYIGKTYITKFDTLFKVEKVVKGSKNGNSDRNSRHSRVAINNVGNRMKITNLIKIVENEK